MNTPVHLLAPAGGSAARPVASAEEIVYRLAASLGAVEGEAFFPSLVAELTSILGLDFAMVVELRPAAQEVTVLASAASSEVPPLTAYSLAGTPCLEVVTGGKAIYAHGLAESFPQDRWAVDAGMEAYVGVALRCRGGNPVGLLAVMHRQPIDDGDLVAAVLQVFASRAAAEIDRKLAEERLRHAQRLESIGTLAGGIAHDLNNVLAPVLMSVDLLFDVVRDERGRRLLASIERSTRRGMDLVRQVLWFARGVEGERRTFAPERLLGEVVKIVRESFPKHVDVIAGRFDDLPPIAGDPTQLYQVLMNLAVNARDAMPGGGTLRIEGREVARAPMTGVSKDGPEPPERFLEVAVSDTGTGVPVEVRDRIFEPFFTTKPPGEGTGLGLATAHSIVAAHGGVIEVESVEGEGSVFRVLLPVAAAAEVAAASPAAATAPPRPERGGGELVLVVDDEPTIRDVCSETLESFGYRALTAADGAEAVALVARYRGEVAAVITDLAMPIMDGPAAIRSIRRLSQRVPILAMSGLADRYGLEEIEEHGISGFLTKPFSADDLLLRLGEALARRSAS